MLTEKAFDTGTVSINYVEGPPSGTPLVMLHGLMGRWQTFLPLLPAFLVRYHTYALDLRGRGLSGRVPGSYFISNDAEDVIAFLRNKVTEPAVLLGHSLGAIVSILVAAEAPDLIRAVVLEDPPLAELSNDKTSLSDAHKTFRALRDMMIKDASMDDKWSELTTIFPKLDDLQTRYSLKTWSQCDPEIPTLVIEQRYFEHYHFEKLLPRIKCPVFLIQGNPSSGGALSDRNAGLAVSLLGDCVHIYLEDVGHGIHAEQPAIFSQMVCDFVESL
jgi:pimeloyl-ACP methyl ester carboxylesterase